MPDSGSGSMTPIPSTGGIASPDRIAPLPYTILSLNRYAKIMGINPAHFWQATAATLNPIVMPVNTCGSIYHQYAWQDVDKVSRFDIASEIAVAENDIANALHYWPGPMWIEADDCDYPKVYRRELFGTGKTWTGQYKEIKATYGMIVQPGRRKATLIGEPSVAAGSMVFSDEDLDGFNETVLVSIATTETDIRNLHVFHVGQGGDQEYEIREPRRAHIQGGVAYFVYDSYLFILPDLYERPTVADDQQVIDISSTDYFVNAVEVYKVYADPSKASAEFIWRGESFDCAPGDPCTEQTSDGCAFVTNPSMGIFAPLPATYNAEGGNWSSSEWSTSFQPERARLWYQSGLVSREYQRGKTNDPLPHEMARIIAYLATARLKRPLCGCTNVSDMSENLRRNTTSAEQGAGMFFTTTQVVNNPFGTRMGEVMAWRELTKLMRRVGGGAVI